MRPEPSQRIDSRALVLWRIHAGISTLLLTLLLLSPLLVGHWAYGLSWHWVVPVAALLVLNLVLQIWLVPVLRLRIWRYELTEHELELQRGLIVVERTLIPLVRVQHVDTRQGPLARALGLSSVAVSTAAGTHEIPALGDEMAEALRDRISALAREAREPI